MTITNDTITFQAADFDALSDFAKAALPPYSGTTPFAETFAAQINEHIRVAKELAKQTTITADPRIDEILSGLAAADPAKLAEAEPLLTDLQNLFK